MLLFDRFFKAVPYCQMIKSFVTLGQETGIVNEKREESFRKARGEAMRIIIKALIIGFCFSIIAFIFLLDEHEQEELLEEIPIVGEGNHSVDEYEHHEANEEDETERENEQAEPEEVVSNIEEETDEQKNSYHYFLGKGESELLAAYGDPVRKDQTPYGYEWYVWNEGDLHFQAGIEDGKVVTLYTNEPASETSPFEIGSPFEKVAEEWELAESVSFTNGYNSYEFNLSKDEVETRPLVELEEGWAQLYFDTFDETLSSVRYLDKETLLKHQPYNLVYRGSLPEQSELSPEEWEEVERGMARQVFDLTNTIRERHNLPLLEWDDETAHVAFFHSKDMQENNYFSHTSPSQGELRDRLQAEEIQFRMAAENIAAKYSDAAAAVEGWLNSEGHRVNLLNDEFTHIGVGVYRDFYTQNFLIPW